MGMGRHATISLLWVFSVKWVSPFNGWAERRDIRGPLRTGDAIPRVPPEGTWRSPRPDRVSDTKRDEAMCKDDDGHGARPKNETISSLRTLRSAVRGCVDAAICMYKDSLWCVTFFYPYTLAIWKREEKRERERVMELKRHSSKLLFALYACHRKSRVLRTQRVF